jgi:hypothetical protein
VAVCGASRSRLWREVIGVDVTDVVTRYRPWSDAGGYWCSRITLFFGNRRVDLLLVEPDRERRLAPSADHIAVVFAPTPLPEWERYPG